MLVYVLILGFIVWGALKSSNWLFPPAVILVSALIVIIGKRYEFTISEGVLSLAVPVAGVVTGLVLISSQRCEENEPQTSKNRLNKDKDVFKVTLQTDRNKKLYIEDINRGIAIFGASGSGKTESVIYTLLKHYADHRFSGILNDYKDFELSEIAYPLFREQGIDFKTFAIADPTRSVRINPIDPRYIKTEADVNGLVKALMSNLNPTEGNDDTALFFQNAAASLLAGVIWRLKTSYPEKCNLPFIIALLLNAKNLHRVDQPYGKLVDFLTADPRAEILASTFLTGVGASKQTAALFSTLADGLRSLSTPEVFYLLSASDISLDLNNPDHMTVLSLVNNPGPKRTIISPIIATIIEACFSQMSVRSRNPSFIVLDEAPTIKIANLSERVATLRSYNVSFVYCMQDKVQGLAQYGGRDYLVKQNLTNLSTQFMGKVNDPDTASFYEKYFELIQKTQVSVSRKDTIFSSSDQRITRSKKEQSKIRAFEFFKLRKGEFVMFNDGVDRKFRFKWEPPVKMKPPVERMITPVELEENYLNILHQASTLFA